MPFSLALAGVLASLASTGVGVGTEIANSGPPPQPSAPTPAPAAQNIAAEVAKRQQQGAIVAQQDPNVVANTSGSLTGLSDQTFASQDAGQPGAFGQGGLDLSKIMQFLGSGGGGGSSPTNLVDLASGGGGSITG